MSDDAAKGEGVSVDWLVDQKTPRLTAGDIAWAIADGIMTLATEARLAREDAERERDARIKANQDLTAARDKRRLSIEEIERMVDEALEGMRHGVPASAAIVAALISQGILRTVPSHDPRMLSNQVEAGDVEVASHLDGAGLQGLREEISDWFRLARGKGWLVIPVNGDRPADGLVGDLLQRLHAKGFIKRGRTFHPNEITEALADTLAGHGVQYGGPRLQAELCLLRLIKDGFMIGTLPADRGKNPTVVPAGVIEIDHDMVQRVTDCLREALLDGGVDIREFPGLPPIAHIALSVVRQISTPRPAPADDPQAVLNEGVENIVPGARPTKDATKGGDA